MSTFQQGIVQVNASADMDDNIATASEMARALAGKGAEIISFPENVSMMEFGGRNIIARSFAETEHPALEAFQALASELKVWMHIGSLAILLDSGKVANRTYVLDDQGQIKGRYDKIHMFDVDLPGGESYRESNTFNAGDQGVLIETPFAKMGLSICYDLRFPNLYHGLAQAGAQILYIPAAFTRQTGKAHWEILLRARAIETGCFVVAAAQCGDHKGGRQTYGHSMIISPWGKILAQGGEDPVSIMAECDLSFVDQARSQIPALKHARDINIG